ncbi:MAG: hypothetical protein BWK80_16855 [Desulfobacteraceae bacterium IS3]|nr:MAG: hypothetical protein BWK80_16855 [Desulfobacteraceae bacterium IS3]
MKKNIALILFKICIVCPIFLLFCSFSVLCQENPPTDNYPPIIRSVSQPQTISCTNSALLYADVIDESDITKVWAEITPPNYQPDPDKPITKIDSIDLVHGENSFYQATYHEFKEEGTYSIAIYAEDAKGNRSEPTETTVTVFKEDKAIIVAGGGYEGDILWPATRKCANLAHYALTRQGYTKDTIYYLSSADTELDADNNNIRDKDATEANFEYAVKTWAKDGAKEACHDIFIYMVDHGGPEKFRMKSDLLDAKVLDSWLDEVQTTLTGKVIVLYDACESGSFIPSLTPPEGKERIVATSTECGESAVFANEGYDSFSYRFFGNLSLGAKFYDAFVSAKKSIQLISKQRPRIDANGNGKGSEDEDKALAEGINKLLGYEKTFADDIPIIEKCTSNQSLQKETCVLLYADNIKTTNAINEVVAVIRPPNYITGSSDTPITNLTRISLNPAGSNRYEAQYCEFKEKGDYHIIIYAVDTKGTLGSPEEVIISKFDLSDVIVALKTFVKTDESGTASRYAVSPVIDVNGDGKIGLEEVIYVLQKIAEGV